MPTRALVWAALCGAMSGVAAATPLAAQGLAHVDLVCEAVYQPARSSWTRTVRISFDRRRVRAVAIDGQPVFTFTVQGTTVLTGLDNERIQIDTAAQTWHSDFRGQATSEGRCERQE